MPLRNTLASALLAGLLWTGPALQAKEEAWVEVKSPHYTAVSNAGEAEARAALRQFEAIREVFRKLLPAARTETGRPLTLVVLQDDTAMQRFLPRQFEGRDPSRPAGWFMQSQDQDFAVLRLDVQHSDQQPYFTLYHEFVHGIIHANLEHLPTWLDEGIADFYGATEIRRDRVRIGRVPEARLNQLRQSPLLPAEVFFAVSHDSPHYREGGKKSLFYAQSWAAVHYLFMDPGAQQQGLLGKLVQALEAGGDPLEAHRRAFGDLKAFIGTLNSYARQPGFRYWDYELALKLDDRAFPTRRLDRAEALALRAEVLLGSGQADLALPLLQEALAQAPGLARVHLALGLLRFRAGEDLSARGHFLEAQRLDGQDFRPPYYLGSLALRGHDPADLGPIRPFERCIALNPAFAPAHSMLGLALLRDPEGRGRALAASRRAVELDPTSLALRAHFGEVCLALDQEAQAQAIADDLRAAARTPQDRQLAEAFAQRLAEHQAHRKRVAESRLQAEQAAARSAPTGTSGEIRAEPRRTSLKFRLPEKYRELGQAVLTRMYEGREPEALALVQGALAKATAAEDRKALQALLGQLRGSPGPAK